jgi:hypothetical protein
MADFGILEILALTAVAAAVGGGASVYSSAKTGAAQKEASEKSQQQAQIAAAEQEQRARAAAAKQAMEINRANTKKPNVDAIMSSAQQAAKGGASGTMLTGPSGVSQSSLALGKTSLLGE